MKARHDRWRFLSTSPTPLGSYSKGASKGASALDRRPTLDMTSPTPRRLSSFEAAAAATLEELRALGSPSGRRSSGGVDRAGLCRGCELARLFGVLRADPPHAAPRPFRDADAVDRRPRDADARHGERDRTRGWTLSAAERRLVPRKSSCDPSWLRVALEVLRCLQALPKTRREDPGRRRALRCRLSSTSRHRCTACAGVGKCRLALGLRWP
jgi:hypothetical protein